MHLRKGDLIVVKWSDDWVRHTPGAKKIKPYNVVDVYKDSNEVICQKKGNHYFNYRMYLDGKSSAEEVLMIYLDEED